MIEQIDPELYHALRTCARKAAFGTRKLAKTSAASLARRNGNTKFHVYKCQYCSMFHLTSWQKKKPKPLRHKEK